MKYKLLLPATSKKWGFLLLVPSAIIGLLNVYNDFQIGFLDTSREGLFGDFSDGNMTNELALSGTILGLIMIAFAREKYEDEFIHRLRLESWQWAVLINFGLLFIANWLFYGTQFLHVMIYNMLTVLIIFIIRFQWLLNRYKRQSAD